MRRPVVFQPHVHRVLPGLFVRGIAPPLRLADYRLIAFDMDSTLINIECIDEIADAVGRGAEVAAITEAAMNGQFGGDIADYKASLRQRVALLEGAPVAALAHVYAHRLQVNAGADLLIEACRDAGLATLLLSGGFTWFTDRIRKRLHLDHARSNMLEVVDGRLTGRLLDQPWGDVCDGAEKRRALLQICEQIGAAPAQAITMGDGANDLDMMAVAGLAVAYRAKPMVRDRAHVVIDMGGLDRLLEVFEPTS